MSLREELQDTKLSIDEYYLSDETIDMLINKVLDAAVEAQFYAATELGIDRQAKHYLEEAINKLRGD